MTNYTKEIKFQETRQGNINYTTATFLYRGKTYEADIHHNPTNNAVIVFSIHNPETLNDFKSKSIRDIENELVNEYRENVMPNIKTNEQQATKEETNTNTRNKIITGFEVVERYTLDAKPHAYVIQMNVNNIAYQVSFDDSPQGWFYRHSIKVGGVRISPFKPETEKQITEYFLEQVKIYEERLQQKEIQEVKEESKLYVYESNSMEETNLILESAGLPSYNDSFVISFRVQKKVFFTAMFGNLEAHTQQPYFATTGLELNHNRSSSIRGGQCQKSILVKGSLPYDFFKKWDTLHCQTLTIPQLTELNSDIEALKSKYAFIESDRFDAIVKFDREMSKR